jgi:hypothetical protein
MKAFLQEIQTFSEIKGDLSVIDFSNYLNFPIKRIYYLYNFAGQVRGNHSHSNLHQCFIAINGTVEVKVTHAQIKKTFLLNTKSKALIIPPNHWLSLTTKDTDAICLVLASEEYKKTHYINDYENFKKADY